MGHVGPRRRSAVVYAVAIRMVVAIGAAGAVVLASCAQTSSVRDASTYGSSSTLPISTDVGSSTGTAAAIITSPASATAVAPATPTATVTAPLDPAVRRSGPPSTVAELLDLGRPIVLAHTGGEDAYPGSTMFAFGESVREGVDMLDLNVVLTADGVLVVQHDLTVDRLTEATGAVADMTADQLAELDDAYWFTPDGSSHDEPVAAYIYRGIRTGIEAPPAGYTADDFAIPTLEQLIRRHPDMTLNIELKDAGERGALAARVLATVLHDRRAEAAVVTSFDDATVDAFRAAAPTVEVSPGLSASAAWVLDATPLPAGMRILQLPPEFNGVAVVTPDSVAAAHRAGYVIWVWPNDAKLENAGSYDRFLAEGIDGLNINYPGEGVAAVRRVVPTTT